MIRKIKEEELKTCYEVVVSSFLDVAESIGATKENCPGNSAFLTYNQFLRNAKKMTLYGYFEDELIGCIGLMKKSDVNAKIKMLSVSKNHRHKGIGRQLVEYIECMVTGRLKLGMIYENELLFEWYKSLGYEVDKIVAYKGNVFRVAYMEKKIEKNL